MINISKETKSFIDRVNLFGHVFNPFFVDEDNKLLIHLDSVINKYNYKDKVIVEAMFLMYKKFESQDVKADIEVRVILKDRKIRFVYYEIHHMAVIEEVGDLIGVQPLYFNDPIDTLKERKIFLSYISHCINELVRRCFNDERSDS